MLRSIGVRVDSSTVMILIVFVVVLLVLAAGAGVVVWLVARKGSEMIGEGMAAAGLSQAGQVTSGQTDPVAQHADQVQALEGMAGRFGIHLDLADALGTKVPGTGMTQPTRATMHIVGRSAQDARAMRAPCQIAYAIEAPGVPAFSGEQVFEISTNQWPEPGDTVPCLYDAANPTHVDIDWGQVQTTGDKALGDAQTLANQLNQQKPPGTP
jgi:hypothetical protein